MKWDGDMVAMPACGRRIRELLERSNVIRFRGIDLVNGNMIGERKFAAMDPRVFRVGPGTFYETGPMCERLTVNGGIDIEEPLYRHYKWSKSIESAQKAWPANWQDLPHFQQIMKRAIPVDEYNECQIPTT